MYVYICAYIYIYTHTQREGEDLEQLTDDGKKIIGNHSNFLRIFYRKVN